MNDKLKVVLDTQVFVRALINPFSINAAIMPQHWTDHYTLYLADSTEAELVKILNRASFRRKFPQITNRAVERFLDVLQHVAIRVKVPQPIESVSRDPKDDIFLACAKAAQADFLVSEDNDLLVLKTHYGTRIVNVQTFLAELNARRTPDDRNSSFR